jgi:hypothetical protein
LLLTGSPDKTNRRESFDSVLRHGRLSIAVPVELCLTPSAFHPHGEILVVISNGNICVPKFFLVLNQLLKALVEDRTVTVPYKAFIRKRTFALISQGRVLSSGLELVLVALALDPEYDDPK